MIRTRAQIPVADLIEAAVDAKNIDDLITHIEFADDAFTVGLNERDKEIIDWRSALMTQDPVCFIPVLGPVAATLDWVSCILRLPIPLAYNDTLGFSVWAKKTMLIYQFFVSRHPLFNTPVNPGKVEDIHPPKILWLSSETTVEINQQSFDYSQPPVQPNRSEEHV